VLNQIWMREEANLWEWLEDRTRIGEAFGFDDAVTRRYEREGKHMAEKIHHQETNTDPRMVQMQVDEAIRVTEERLGVLKKVNQEKKKKAEQRIGKNLRKQFDEDPVDSKGAASERDEVV